MPKDKVWVEGIPEAIERLKKWQFIKTQAVKDRLKKQAFKVELAAKEMCPVKYGRLRASISTNWSGSDMDRAKIKSPCTAPENPSKSDDAIGRPSGPSELVCVVGTNVTYGPHVEHGTSKMPGRPYLFPAYFMYEGETVLAIGTILKQDIQIK